MAGLKWLPEALNDLERLFAFLREKSPAAAARAAETILEGADLLLTSPRLAQITMLCSRPSFLCKQASRLPAPRPLDAGSRPA